MELDRWNGYLREPQLEMDYIGLSCSTFNGHPISLGSIIHTSAKLRDISRINSCGHRVVLGHTVPTDGRPL